MQQWHETADALLTEYSHDAVYRVRTGQVEGRWHPTGFIVFHLGVIEHGWRLRLHVWPTMTRRSLTGHPPIHNHVWELASRILVGRYSDLVYQRTNLGRSYILHSAQTDETTGLTNIWPTGTIRLDQWEPRLVDAGSVHFIPAGQPHQTINELGVGTATLVIMGPIPSDSELIMAGQKSFSIQNYDRPLPSPDEYETAFGLLADFN